MRQGRTKPNLCGNTIVYVGLIIELSWLVRVPDVQTIVLSQTLGLLKRVPEGLCRDAEDNRNTRFQLDLE